MPLASRSRVAIQTLWRLLYSQPRYVTLWSIFMASRTDGVFLRHLRSERQKLRDRSIANFLATFPELDRASDREAFAEVVYSALRGLGMVQLFKPAEQVNQGQLEALSELVTDRCLRAKAAPASNQARFGPRPARDPAAAKRRS